MSTLHYILLLKMVILRAFGQWKEINFLIKTLGYVNIVKMLLMHEAKINAVTSSNQTALLLAIQNGE